jgi:TPR repeat protein
MKKTIAFTFLILLSSVSQGETFSDLEKKAELGTPSAIMKLGIIYEKGLIKQEKNLDKAKKYYLLASQKGVKQSYSRLGDIEYTQGNLRKALEYWNIGAQLKDSASTAYLGRHYFNRAEFFKANEYLKTSAIDGIPMAQFYLSKIYEQGRIGAKNIVYAHAWMTISARNYKDAKKELITMEKMMNNKQLKASKNISNTFIKNYFSKK